MEAEAERLTRGADFLGLVLQVNASYFPVWAPLEKLDALPNGLSRVVDTGRVGMFGQSAGGITAAQDMYEDQRIKAGIDLDGTLDSTRNRTERTSCRWPCTGSIARSL